MPTAFAPPVFFLSAAVLAAGNFVLRCVIRGCLRLRAFPYAVPPSCAAENTAGYSICAAAVNEDFTAGYVNALGNNTNIEQVYNDGQGDGEGHWFINAEGQLERRGDINADAGTWRAAVSGKNVILKFIFS